MRTVNIHEAKTHLSRLVEEVRKGEEIVIARAGRPVARLVPIAPEGDARTLGILAGAFTVPDDFDAPLPDDLIADFES
jgi:prevent-host-death family protein